MKFQHGALRFLSALALAVSSYSSFATPMDSPESVDDPIETRPYLFGNWDGLRDELKDKGLDFSFGYVSEIAYNRTGGERRRKIRNTNQWSAMTTADLGKLWGWDGLTFRMAVTSRAGRNLSNDAKLGTNQQVQEVWGRGQTWRLTRLWLEKNFNDVLLLKAGRLDMGEDFFSFECSFQNLTFCGSAPGNVVGDYWYNWPVSQWGTRFKWFITPEVSLQLGMFQVSRTYVDNRWAQHHGWEVRNAGKTQGANIPLELGWTPKINDLPGNYKIGGWYTTANANDLYQNRDHESRGENGGDPRRRNHRFGTYLSFQQQVSGVADKQGFKLFLNYLQADRNTSAWDRQFATGFYYLAPFDRVNDSIGVAFGGTHASHRQARYQRVYNKYNSDDQSPVLRGYEYVSEVYYSWSPVASVQIAPNVQFVQHPGATKKHNNVVIFGAKTDISF